MLQCVDGLMVEGRLVWAGEMPEPEHCREEGPRDWRTCDGSGAARDGGKDALTDPAREQAGEGPSLHPTQKPVEVFARPIRYHTLPGEICLEPFSGSGSQIIAAERLGRRCFAIELAPAYVDVAVERWEKFTGKKAEGVKP